MISKEMHYDFKQKLNRIDSQKERNLLVPEIDWKLNEAQNLLIKMIVQPRISQDLGFEFNQRTIDDIRPIVVDQKPTEGIVPTIYDENSYVATLPKDYVYYNNSTVYATKGKCVGKKMKRVIEVQHDDEHENSPFNVSSFEWREVNASFNSSGIRLFTDGTFSIDKICLQYIRQPRLIHNAADFDGGSYEQMDGTLLSGTQDCELPSIIHSEIVDLAVLIAATDLNSPDFQLKRYKLSLNNLK